MYIFPTGFDNVIIFTPSDQWEIDPMGKKKREQANEIQIHLEILFI